MKRIISLFLALAFMPQLVLASSANGLKQAIDEYSYSMTVEWDQNDPAYSEAQSRLFAQRVKDLIKAGLSKEEIAAALPGINLEQFNTELMLIDVKNPEAVAGFMKKKMASAYSQGASWNGRVVNIIAPLLIVGAIVGLILFINAESNSPDDTSGGTGDGDGNGDGEICPDGQCYLECNDPESETDCVTVCPILYCY